VLQIFKDFLDLRGGTLGAALRHLSLAAGPLHITTSARPMGARRPASSLLVFLGALLVVFLVLLVVPSASLENHPRDVEAGLDEEGVGLTATARCEGRVFGRQLPGAVCKRSQARHAMWCHFAQLARVYTWRMKPRAGNGIQTRLVTWCHLRHVTASN
jgi:hypothetical protein